MEPPEKGRPHYSFSFFIIILAQTVVHSVRWAHLYFFKEELEGEWEVIQQFFFFFHLYFAVRVPTQRRRISRKPVGQTDTGLLVFFFLSLSLSTFAVIKHAHTQREITYGIVTGKSGPSSLEPSQKQSSGVMMAHGKMFSKI